MADTPRGPRPTRSRRVALMLTVGWLLVLAIVAAAALAPRVLVEDGWSRERATLVKVPYADCDAGRCTMRPTVELDDGRRQAVRLEIRHPDEMLPSRHFREGGSVLLWVPDDVDQQPRSLRPISAAARLAARWLLALAAVLAAILVRLALRAPTRHDARNAGHFFDHVATWALPAIVVLVSLVLAFAHLQWRTPQHDPVIPPAAARQSTP